MSSFFQLTTFVAFYAFFTDALVIALLVIVVSYNHHLRISKINYEIERVVEPNASSHEISKAIKKFNEEHNIFVTQIWSFNNYGKNIYLIFLITAFPINLSAMHQVIFEKIELQLRIFFTIGVFCHDLILFGLQLSFASFSKKVHKMCVNLSRLQWRVRGFPFRTRTKLKLLATFERLSSKKKIGITVGSVVMTFPIFYKVSMLFSLSLLISIWHS